MATGKQWGAWQTHWKPGRLGRSSGCITLFLHVDCPFCELNSHLYFFIIQKLNNQALEVKINGLARHHRVRCHLSLNDTGENVQKWTRVFSTQRGVILVARTRRKKREENSVSTFRRFRLWTSFESLPVSVNICIF